MDDDGYNFLQVNPLIYYIVRTSYSRRLLSTYLEGAEILHSLGWFLLSTILGSISQD